MTPEREARLVALVLALGRLERTRIETHLSQADAQEDWLLEALAAFEAAPQTSGVPKMADLLAALKVCGIEPPENDGEPWSICLNENGPEEGEDTATEAARLVMDDFTRCDDARVRAEALVAAYEAMPENEAVQRALLDSWNINWKATGGLYRASEAIKAALAAARAGVTEKPATEAHRE